MERSICKHVLPLSLLLSRGGPNPVFHQRRTQRQLLHLELASSFSGLDSSHAGKGETHKGQEMVYHKNACACRRQGILLFSQCRMHQWKKKGWNEKDTTTLSSTYYIPLWNTGKAETGQTCSLLNLQPLYIPFMVSNVTLEKSYHLPLSAWRLHTPNNTRPKYRVMNCTVKNRIAPSPFNAVHSNLLV